MVDGFNSSLGWMDWMDSNTLQVGRVVHMKMGVGMWALGIGHGR